MSNTHQLLATMGFAPVQSAADDEAELLYYKPSRPGRAKSPKRKAPQSIPSLGCDRIEHREHRSPRESLSKGRRRTTPREQEFMNDAHPRRDLSESMHRASRMSQIFLTDPDPAFRVSELTREKFQSLVSEDSVMSEEQSFFSEDVTILNDIEKPVPARKLEDSDRTDVTFNRSASTFFGFDDEEETEQKRPQPEPNHRKNSFFHHMSHRYKALEKECWKFKGLKMVQILFAIIAGILTLVPAAGLRDPESRLIVDLESAERTERGLILVNGVERGIVASTHAQVVCIGLTRMCAFFMYPALVMVFTTKFRATISFLTKTPFAMYMYKDSHELHIYCGWTILLMSIIHTVGHIGRWIAQGNIYLLYQHFTGLSGLLIITSCLLICIPMTIFRTQIRYEIRKNLHFLFLVFAGALMFHTTPTAIPNGGFTNWVFAIIIAWYFADATYCYFFMTEKIDTTKFAVLPCGVRMTMAVSKRFQKMGNQGGVCYVCLPWIDKNQWHAFSLFENPSNPAERQIFIQKTGDWTTQVHRVLQRETVRPAWVHGPFPSPYDNAISYDNQVLVASGIGITPALSVIRAHKGARRINLVWAVRDEALLEFFLKHLYLDHDGWNIIFYTGKKKLQHECVHIEADTNICIISGRPNLKELIPNIIYGIESGLGLPENYTPGAQAAATNLLVDRLLASGDTDDVVEDVAIQASELGFRLPMEPVAQEVENGRRSTAKRRVSEAIMGNLSIGFRPWNYHEGAHKYVKDLDDTMILPTWGMLYCGGAKPVLDALEEVSEEYDIGLHVESFAW